VTAFDRNAANLLAALLLRAVSRALFSIASVVVPLCVSEMSAAGEYAVEVGGTRGIRIAGKCLLISEDKSTSHDVSGTVPLILEYSGDVISCALQRKAGTGTLQMVIKDKGGRLVAESSEMQPFGIIMAGGR
jgi:hypothetical protein